jgi:electron transfer flavoprotein beta subunit
VKIVVPIKQVAALDDEFEMLEDGSGVDSDFIEWEINEWDSFSVEAALQIREAAGGEVVAVTVDDEKADDALRTCLAMGVDRGVRVWDDALEGADALAVARVVAAAVERESPDLVLCGVQSSDAVNSATGIAVSARLGLPHVAVVRHVEYDAAGATVTVQRELEGGLIEAQHLDQPALLTIQTGANEPRYATLRAIKQAREKPLEAISLDDVGLDEAAVEAAAGSRLRRLSLPEKQQGATLISGSPAEVAARIAHIVKEQMSA